MLNYLLKIIQQESYFIKSEMNISPTPPHFNSFEMRMVSIMDISVKF